MSSKQLVKRLLVSETGLSSEKIRGGKKLEDYEIHQLHQRIRDLSTAPLYIDDTPSLSIYEFRSKARRLRNSADVKLIIIDYLQLMTGPPELRGVREQEVANISRSLKAIAKELESIQEYYYYGGGHFINNGDQKAAYEMFKIMGELCQQDFMANSKINCQDTMHMQARYFAAMTAVQLGNYEDALKSLDVAKEDNYNILDIYNAYAYVYEQTKDTTNLIATFKEGIKKFGSEVNSKEYAFLARLINIYINQDNVPEAIALIEEALVDSPDDCEYMKLLGSLYYEQKNEEKAIEVLKKAIDTDPTYAAAYGELGRIFYNNAITISNEVSEIQDNNEYRKAREEKVKPAFLKAAPYFEKALELDPSETTYMYSLKNIYYNAEDGANLERIENMMGE